MTKKANPAPLGLLGFGLTTILLNIATAGITDLSFVVIAMGITLGGLAQIIAGILEFKQGNTFGGTAFTAYGFFWISKVLIYLLPQDYTGFTVTNTDMGFYLLVWGIFTAFMFIGTFKSPLISKLVFGSLTLLFFLLSAGNFLQSDVILTIAGITGIICGSLAFYEAGAAIVNEQLGRKVFPL